MVIYISVNQTDIVGSSPTEKKYTAFVLAINKTLCMHKQRGIKHHK